MKKRLLLAVLVIALIGAVGFVIYYIGTQWIPFLEELSH